MKYIETCESDDVRTAQTLAKSLPVGGGGKGYVSLYHGPVVFSSTEDLSLRKGIPSPQPLNCISSPRPNINWTLSKATSVISQGFITVFHQNNPKNPGALRAPGWKYSFLQGFTMV